MTDKKKTFNSGIESLFEQLKIIVLMFFISMRTQQRTLTKSFSIRGSKALAHKLNDVIDISPVRSLMSKTKISPSPCSLLKRRTSYLNETIPRIFHLVKQSLFVYLGNDTARNLYLLFRSKLISPMLINSSSRRAAPPP